MTAERREGKNMKALVLYRSFHGNTKAVADAIAGELVSLGHEAVVQDLRRRLPDLGSFDCALVGAPTRMARVTGKALRVLKRIAKQGFGEKPVAIFDTYGPVPATPEELEKGRKWIIPGAAGHDGENRQGRWASRFRKDSSMRGDGAQRPTQGARAAERRGFRAGARLGAARRRRSMT